MGAVQQPLPPAPNPQAPAVFAPTNTATTIKNAPVLAPPLTAVPTQQNVKKMGEPSSFSPYQPQMPVNYIPQNPYPHSLGPGGTAGFGVPYPAYAFQPGLLPTYPYPYGYLGASRIIAAAPGVSMPYIATGQPYMYLADPSQKAGHTAPASGAPCYSLLPPSPRPGLPGR